MKILQAVMLCALLALPAGVSPAWAAEDKKPAATDEKDYVDLQPLSVPVINDTGLVQQVSVAVSLECPMGKRDQVNAYRPRLMDAYLRELYGALGSGRVMMRNNVVDVEAVRARLGVVTQKIVGPDLVSDVLLQSVHQYAHRSR